MIQIGPRTRTSPSPQTAPRVIRRIVVLLFVAGFIAIAGCGSQPDGEIATESADVVPSSEVTASPDTPAKQPTTASGEQPANNSDDDRTASVPEPAVKITGEAPSKTTQPAVEPTPVATETDKAKAPHVENAAADPPKVAAENDGVEIEPESETRLPVPDADAQKQTAVEIRQIFAEDYSEARKSDTQAALAQKLIGQAAEEQSELKTYVLLTEARDLAVEAVDPNLVQEAVDGIDKRYEVDGRQFKSDAFKLMLRRAKSSQQFQSLAASALALGDDAAAAEKFDVAVELIGTANSAASRARDADLRAEVKDKRTELRLLKRQWDDALDARAKLTDSPDDPAANHALGYYLCFIKDDWADGLPHLTRIELQELRQAAQLELKPPAPADEQAKTGDAWWTLAKATRGPERVNFRIRANHWYRQAVDDLEGLEKARVEKQIQEIDNLAIKESKTSKKAQGKKAAAGMIGRVTSAGKDIGLIVGYIPGLRLRHDNFQRLMGSAGLSTNSVRIELTGVLSLKENAPVLIRQAGGSSSGGIHRLYINGVELGSVGDDRTKDQKYHLAFPKGNHMIKWVLTGGRLGDNLVQFQHAQSGLIIPVYYTTDMLESLRKLPTAAEVGLATK